MELPFLLIAKHMRIWRRENHHNTDFSFTFVKIFRTMIFRIVISIALTFSIISTATASDLKKYLELFAKYEECYDSNDYRGSVKFLEEALIYVPTDSTIYYSDIYNGLAYAYWDMGQYDKAVDYGKRCLECDLVLGDSTRISTSFNLLAILFTHQKLFDEAEQYLLQAITYVPHNNTKMKAGRYAVLGEILSANGRDAEAIGYIRQAYALDSADNRTDKMPVRLSQLGEAYLRQKEFDKAEVTLAKASEGLRAAGNDYSLCINLLAQTKNYMALGRKAEAEKTALEGLDLSNKLNRRRTKLEALHYLAELRKSPELYEQTLALNDSLYNEQISQQIADFEVRYATAEKEKEKAELQVIINHQRYALVVIVIVFAAILIGAVLGYIVRRMRRDIEHTEKMARELFVIKHPSVNLATTGNNLENKDIIHRQNKADLNSTTEDSPIRLLPNEPINAPKPAAETTDDGVKLSPREREIIKACCQGKLSKEIADDFGISKKTVDNHKSTIYQKIGVCNNTELILYAVKHGFASV